MDLLYTLTSYAPAVGGAQLLSHHLIQQVQQHHGVTVACHWQRNRHDWLLGTTLGQPPPNKSWVEGVPVHQLGLTAWQKLALVPAVALYSPHASGPAQGGGDRASPSPPWRPRPI
jgi:hypothetical protein